MSSPGVTCSQSGLREWWWPNKGVGRRRKADELAHDVISGLRAETGGGGLSTAVSGEGFSEADGSADGEDAEGCVSGETGSCV